MKLNVLDYVHILHHKIKQPIDAGQIIKVSSNVVEVRAAYSYYTFQSGKDNDGNTFRVELPATKQKALLYFSYPGLVKSVVPWEDVYLGKAVQQAGRWAVFKRQNWDDKFIGNFEVAKALDMLMHFGK